MSCSAVLVQDGRQHVVLCAAPGSTLQQEMQLLSQANELLAASGKQHLAVFAVDPAEQVRPWSPQSKCWVGVRRQAFGTLGPAHRVPACVVRVGASLRIMALLLEHWLQSACQAAALLPSQPATPVLVVLLTR